MFSCIPVRVLVRRSRSALVRSGYVAFGALVIISSFSCTPLLTVGCFGVKAAYILARLHGQVLFLELSVGQLADNEEDYRERGHSDYHSEEAEQTTSDDNCEHYPERRKPR